MACYALFKKSDNTNDIADEICSVYVMVLQLLPPFAIGLRDLEF